MTISRACLRHFSKFFSFISSRANKRIQPPYRSNRPLSTASKVSISLILEGREYYFMKNDIRERIGP